MWFALVVFNFVVAVVVCLLTLQVLLYLMRCCGFTCALIDWLHMLRVLYLICLAFWFGY